MKNFLHNFNKDSCFLICSIPRAGNSSLLTTSLMKSTSGNTSLCVFSHAQFKQRAKISVSGQKKYSIASFVITSAEK